MGVNTTRGQPLPQSLHLIREIELQKHHMRGNGPALQGVVPTVSGKDVRGMGRYSRARPGDLGKTESVEEKDMKPFCCSRIFFFSVLLRCS